MYAQIRLFSGYKKPLWYHVSDTVSVELGSIVQIPLQKRTVYGLVTLLQPYKPYSCKDIELKNIIGTHQIPSDPHYFTFLQQIADYYAIDITVLLERVQKFLHQKEEAIISSYTEQNATQIPLLTSQQQTVADFMFERITQSVYTPVLLHGITGSGKTEVYKQLIVHTIHQNKTVILLLPEVSLAVAFEERLNKELANSVPIFGFHSGKSAGQKELLWQLLLQKKALLIIGVHLPVLLPIVNLGLIIIDEEHDVGYREKKHPKINSHHAALVRARMYNIPILLGSATPSITTLYAVKQKKCYFFQLTERFGGTLPQIQLVSLRSKIKRTSFWICNELKNAIQDRLAKKEQTIIFLNRRGYSFFVQCKGCGFIFTCSNCSVSLTLHTDNYLQCHYCAHQTSLPSVCPSCKDTKAELLKKGIGTQQAVTILQELFPTARIARADADITRSKKKWHQIMHNFQTGELDILVGTQTITKGYHFPNVTLVGILWADLNLHFPLYNATEVALQQLIQVAGRAGRASTESLVIVQAIHEHAIFDLIGETNYLSFYQQEITQRMATGYPPCKALIELELKYTNEKIVDHEADALAALLLANIDTQSGIRILGPAKPLVHKIKNIQTRVIYIKAAKISDAFNLFKTIDTSQFKSSIHCTPQ